MRLAELTRAPGRLRPWLRDAVPLAGFAAVRPAARLLPLGWGYRVTDAIGWALVLTPPGRRRSAAMAAAFPNGDRGATLARRWLARPFRDYLYLRRIVIGRAPPPRPDEIRGEMGEATRALLASDRSFVVATGHFARQPMLALYADGVIPRHVVAIVAPLPDRAASAADARTIAHFGQMLDGLAVARPSARVVPIGTAAGAREVVRLLSEPGWAAIVAADATIADWMPVAVARPFAGWGSRPFANGTAQLARLAQVPVVVAVPYLGDDGRCTIEWSEPLPPPERRDRQGEARLTDEILDRLERAVGHRPDQYVIDVGAPRRWDPVAGRWEVERS